MTATSLQAVSSMASISGRAPSRRSQPGEKRGRKLETWYGCFSAYPVDVDAKSRRVWNLNAPIDYLHGRGDDLALPIDVELVEEFLHQEVWGTGADLDADRGGNRSLCLMGGDDGIARVGHGTDHPRAQNASHGRGIRLQDVDGVVLQQFRELMRRVETLSGGHGNVDAARHFSGGVDFGVVGRLLEPGRLELGQVIADPDSLRDTEAAMPLDHDLDLRTDGFAHRADDIERKLAITRGHRPPG